MTQLISRPRFLWAVAAFLTSTLAAGAVLSQPHAKVHDLVTLIADSSTPICPAASVPHTFSDRLFPDGSRKPFTTPAGRVFVITSFDWVVSGSSQANNTVWTAVTLIGAGTNNSNNAFSSAAFADSIGVAAGGTLVPEGVVVGPGTSMCLDYVGGATDSFGRVHGYLTEP